MPIRRVQATVYFVIDWEASARFYRETLGLKELVNFPNRWAVYQVNGGGKIALQYAPNGREANHVSIEVTDIGSYVAELKARGAKVVEEVRREDFGEFALIEDPSGNPIFLVDTATSQYPHD
jgi:catechol 2,3-dioxygenase-like lactoylglutathione lyase family enzyme